MMSDILELILARGLFFHKYGGTIRQMSEVYNHTLFVLSVRTGNILLNALVQLEKGALTEGDATKRKSIFNDAIITAIAEVRAGQRREFKTLTGDVLQTVVDKSSSTNWFDSTALRVLYNDIKSITDPLNEALKKEERKDVGVFL